MCLSFCNEICWGPRPAATNNKRIKERFNYFVTEELKNGPDVNYALDIKHFREAGRIRFLYLTPEKKKVQFVEQVGNGSHTGRFVVNSIFPDCLHPFKSSFLQPSGVHSLFSHQYWFNGSHRIGRRKTDLLVHKTTRERTFDWLRIIGVLHEMLQFWPKRGKLSSARLFARMPKEPGTIPRFGDWVAQNQEDARVREEEKERNELMESFENGEYEEAAK